MITNDALGTKNVIRLWKFVTDITPRPCILRWKMYSWKIWKIKPFRKGLGSQQKREKGTNLHLGKKIQSCQQAWKKKNRWFGSEFFYSSDFSFFPLFSPRAPSYFLPQSLFSSDLSHGKRSFKHHNNFENDYSVNWALGKQKINCSRREHFINFFRDK